MPNEQEIIGHVFRCHKNNGSICIGWLMKQDENNHPCNALRIMLFKHNVTRQYLDSLKSPSPLYDTIEEMIRANYPELLNDTNG